eukprot:355768_1
MSGNHFQSLMLTILEATQTHAEHNKNYNYKKWKQQVLVVQYLVHLLIIIIHDNNNNNNNSVNNNGSPTTSNATNYSSFSTISSCLFFITINNVNVHSTNNTNYIILYIRFR